MQLNEKLIDDEVVATATKFLQKNFKAVNAGMEATNEAVSNISESALIDVAALDEPVSI